MNETAKAGWLVAPADVKVVQCNYRCAAKTRAALQELASASP